MTTPWSTDLTWTITHRDSSPRTAELASAAVTTAVLDTLDRAHLTRTPDGARTAAALVAHDVRALVDDRAAADDLSAYVTRVGDTLAGVFLRS